MNEKYFNKLIVYICLCYCVLLISIILCVIDSEERLIKEINKPTRVYYEYNVVGNDTIPVDTVMVKF